MPHRLASRAALFAFAFALAALVGAAGCSKSSKPTAAPTGDDGGTTLLVFSTTRLSASGSEWDVALYDADLGGYRTVAGLNSAYDQSEPCITDDGGFVAFASNRPTGAGGYDVYVYERLTQRLVATLGLNSTGNDRYPRFTHDSVRMTFVRDTLGYSRLRLYDPIAQGLVPLPGLDAGGAWNDDAPAPDLNGNRIAFQSTRAGGPHVYVWDRGTGVESAPALVGDSLDVEPALSSNGRWLAFATNRSGGAGGWDVRLYDLQSSAFVPLPRCNTAGDERHPTVSNDGQTLYFAARADSTQRWSLWRYSLVDSLRDQPAGLPATAGNDRQPYLRGL